MNKYFIYQYFLRKILNFNIQNLLHLIVLFIQILYLLFIVNLNLYNNMLMINVSF